MRATFAVRDGTLTVTEGLAGQPNLTVFADSTSWLRFLAKEVSLLRCLLTLKIRVKGPPRLLAAFGRCFPA